MAWKLRLRPRHDCARVLVGGCAFLLGLAVTGRAQNLSLSVDNVDWRGGQLTSYPVFDENEHPQVVQFEVDHTGSACSFLVGFNTQDNHQTVHYAASGSNRLAYQLSDSFTRPTPLKDLPNALSGELLSGSFSAGKANQQLSYDILVPPQQIVPPGLYGDSITLTLYQGTPTDYQTADSKTIQLNIPVSAVTQVSLVPTGGAFDAHATFYRLNFGTLTEDRTLSLDLRVRSNVGYSITLQSQNGGVLAQSSPAVHTTIPYTLTLAGAAVNLQHGVQTPVTWHNRITSSSGDVYPVTVTLGDTTGATAGDYSDNISVTVTSE